MLQYEKEQLATVTLLSRNKSSNTWVKLSKILCKKKANTTFLELSLQLETNIAIGGIATQSSQYLTASADKAVDGNSNSNWNHGSCSSTMHIYTAPWWRLDLLKNYEIKSVTVTNAEGNYNQIDGAEIRIGNSLENNGNDNPRCQHHACQNEKQNQSCVEKFVKTNLLK